MKNPKTNPEIEAIKSSLCKELGYLPGDKIPNSNVSIVLGKIDATATLIYAKSQNRKARFARPGECQYTIELEKGRAPKVSKPEDALISTAEAAKILEVHASNLNAIRVAGKIEAEKIGGRYFFKPEEVERYRIQRAIDKL
ncbi:helix-turn-helix domain-containing protein [Chryseobacterium sediminis]|uniref:Helix-turn-helix domain-containing protein n=1 Tax=Chryseobacterium sediminis TaxID=1679494 RepID=A0A5B2U9S3_9FLAO|nr:helix-turn-helix domain-containing protein [Chryseobacterium sediminis]KAA2223005.1 helix-turn-helix domain-containing protein [Chryseobacterium sediminis]